jgi:hypothetical protein
MIGLIEAETIKILKRRTYWVMLLVLGALTALLAFVFFLLPRVLPEGEAFPVVEKPIAYLFGAQQVLGQTWFPLILAVMFLAGELATSTWSTALTRNSRRWQHLVARLLTATAATWAAVLVAIAGFGGMAFFLAGGSGFITGGDVWGIVWKSLLTMLTWVALGLAASAWLRSVGPAIGAVIAFSFGEGLLALWSGWRTVSLSINSAALLGNVGDVGGMGGVLGTPPPFGRALVVVIAWLVVAVAGAWSGLQLRDA